MENTTERTVPVFHAPPVSDFEYQAGRIIREAVDHDPDKMRFYLTISVGEVAQKIAVAALTAGTSQAEQRGTRMQNERDMALDRARMWSRQFREVMDKYIAQSETVHRAHHELLAGQQECAFQTLSALVGEQSSAGFSGTPTSASASDDAPRTESGTTCECGHSLHRHEKEIWGGERRCLDAGCDCLLFARRSEPGNGGRPKIVCLVGSSRFVDVAAALSWELEKRGIMALSMNLLPHWYPGVQPDHQAEAENVSATMDALHLCKIDLADKVLVVDVGGYIGDRTRDEIAYAESRGKHVEYLSHGSPPEWLAARVVDGVCDACGGGITETRLLQLAQEQAKALDKIWHIASESDDAAVLATIADIASDFDATEVVEVTAPREQTT